MANKLDRLIPVLYNAMQVISRELIGIIPACRTDLGSQQIAKDQTLRVPVTPPSENQDIVFGQAPTVTGDEFGDIEVKMTKFRIGKPIVWNGEEELGVGDKKRQLLQDQITQRMRSLANEMEEDVCFEAATGAQGDVYGTAGSTPFATADMRDFAQLVKALDDIGSPQTGRQLVVNTTSAANLMNNGVLYRVNESGRDELLRRGILSQLYGFDIRRSAGFRTFAVSGVSGYQVNGAHSVGADRIMADSGSGAIPKGSVIAIGDLQYIVTEDFEGTAGYLKIAPKVRAEIASGTAITIRPSFLPNACFTSDAILLAARTPQMPDGGDAADDVTTVSDTVSGLTFQVASYGGHRQRWIEIGACWGVKTVNPQNSVLLLG